MLNKLVTRCAVLPLCVLLMMFISGSAWAQGTNFSVAAGAVGSPGTAVNAASDPADIYIGGGGNNALRIPKAALGLQAGDEVDALSIPDPLTPNFDDMAGSAGLWYFSVDPGTVGLPFNPPLDVFGQAGPAEAAGDIFRGNDPWVGGGNPAGFGNWQALDESVIGLLAPAAPEDDQDALDLDAGNMDLTQPLPAGTVFFSLATGSASLGGGVDPGDILTTDGTGGFMVAPPGMLLGVASGDHVDLGIAGDDLDALFVDSFMWPVYSVAPACAPWFSPADVLIPNGALGPWTGAGPLGNNPADGIAEIYIFGGTMAGAPWGLMYWSLLPTDNVNSLDASMDELTEPDDPEEVDSDEDGIPDHQEEDDGTDPADPDSDDDGLDDGDEADNSTDPNDPDSDDDGLPDGWEVDNDLDPNVGTGDDGADGDPDGDGFTNQEEYDAGSDPNDSRWTPAGHFVPVTGPFTAAILAAALAAIGLKRRRR